ncbi:hypothetical protein D3C76_1672390 [compost metagenome]
MQMSEAAVLTEVEGIREANERLKAGWRLLAVTVKTSPVNQEQYTYFVLGKPAEQSNPLRDEFIARGAFTEPK